jgi:hypothetical protein
MALTMSITAFVFLAIFSSIGIFEKIKPNGKLSTGTLINITFFTLMLITGVTDIIFKDSSTNSDKKEILRKIDSSGSQINRRMDTLLQKKANPQ